MKVIIMGCGRTGAMLATMLDAEGHSVTILDLNEYSFRRLPPDFKGTALVGDGTDDETLIKAGIKQADAFVAVTQGDNRNIMAAQIAKHIFKIPRVLLRIYDPGRRELYNSLGLEAFSPTTIFAQLLKDNLLGKTRLE
ncbi:MAG: TrkA family potassium uptake protein [Dehalococcoidales bacterium]|jgi:trk system potassium uptake protein TrkA|nr:TrkA family potassium uptake protein [Dehalococcoidales bacterium]